MSINTSFFLLEIDFCFVLTTLPNIPFLQTGQLVTTRLRPAAPGKDDLRGGEPLLPCSSNLAIQHHAQDSNVVQAGLVPGFHKTWRWTRMRNLLLERATLTISHVNSRISDVLNRHLVLHIVLQVIFHYTALLELMASHWSPTWSSVIDNGVAQTNCICLESLFRSTPRRDLCCN